MRIQSFFTAAALAAILAAGCGPASNHDTTEVNGVNIPNILAKDTSSGSPNEQVQIRTTFNEAIEALKANSDDPQPYLSLASAYILESRLSGNNGYYSNAVLRVLDHLISSETASMDQKFQAYTLQSTVYLTMHRFPEALEAAKKGLAISENNAAIWGAFVDANVEMGHYDEAVKASDRMMGLRPDLRSYSRVSYLRQIYGQNLGAVEAMGMAVEAGVPGLEGTEWARVQLGDLYLYKGNADSARLMYRYALVYRPGYPYAEIGMAKADMYQQRYDSAISHARTAVKALPESAFIALLADLYELKGDNTKATEMRSDVKRLLEEADAAEPKDAAVKHNGARELAQAHLALKEYDKALEYANVDYKIRPDNIDANDLMAWVTYVGKNDPKGALPYVQKSMVTGMKNPSMLYKDGLIYRAAGNAAMGDSLIREAQRLSPQLDPRVMRNAPKA